MENRRLKLPTGIATFEKIRTNGMFRLMGICLQMLFVTSCRQSHDISSKEYYEGAPDIGHVVDMSDENIAGVNLIPVKIDSMETSYVGYFWLNRDTLYFSDLSYYYIYSIRPDGSIIKRHVGRGQGPNEVSTFEYSVPIINGYYLFTGYEAYLFDNQWNKISQNPIYWGGKKGEGFSGINKLNPAEPIFYEHYIFLRENIQLWDSIHIAMQVESALPNFFWLDNTGHYFDYSRIIALVNIYTGEVDRVLGRRSPFFLKKPNLPTMDFIGFTQVADTVFVSFFPDSVIYMIDKHNDRAIGKFGQQGRNMNTEYISINSIEESWEREKEDWEKLGYYTYLKYDEKRQLLFRGYQQGEHSQFDGLQIYKNHALIGDVDVPKGFYIIGYLNDQLIGSIEDKEIKELDLYFYHVIFNKKTH